MTLRTPASRARFRSFFRLRRLPGLGLLLASVLAAGTGCSGDDDDDDHDDAGESGEAGEAGRGGRGGGGGGGNPAMAGSLSMGGSSSGGRPPDLQDLPQVDEADWTLFVYGHGDHNLSNSLLTDLREMAAADLDAANVNVLVLTDWDASQIIPGSNENFPDGVQLFRVPGNGKGLEVVAEAPELNLDEAAVLAGVVEDVFRGFPARRRGIVLWDHGGAWSGGFGSDTQNGTVRQPTAMPIAALPVAIQAGLEAAGVSATPPLDLVAFDTCLMAGAEVAYPFRDLASVYIANAEIDYGAGWDYTATFSYIAAHPDDTAASIARAEVSHWDAHHVSVSPNDALLRSHVAIDLGKIEDFAEATRAFTRAVAAGDDLDPIDLGRSSFLALPPYASQFENAGSTMPGLRDAGQLFRALGESDADTVAEAATAARAALEDLILARSQGSLRDEASQMGLHVELSPAAQITSQKRSEYADRASAWVRASGWGEVLATLADAADAVAPTFAPSVQNADGASSSAPPILEFSTPDADAAKGAVYLGRNVDAETIVLLGLIGSGSVEAGADYEFGWDGSVAAFPDGQPAMLDVWLDSGSDAAEPVLTVPGLLSGASAEPLVTYLVFTPSEGAASVAVVSLGEVASTLSLAEISEAAPGATFSPLYYAISTSSGEAELVTGDAMALPGNGAYSFSALYLPEGGYLFLTQLTDVWGNQSAEPSFFTLAESLEP
jgi:hypothetical protein